MGVSNHLYTLWLDQANAVACATTAKHSNAVGQFTLTGTGLAGSRVLLSGVSFGGITVATGLDSVELDSSSITGLAPGNYVLHIFQQGSATSAKDVPFVVPARVRQIRFVDSAGTNANLPGIVTDVHQAVLVYLAAFQDSLFCATCQDSVSLTSGNPHLRILASPSGPSLSSVRLVGGKAEVWLLSTVPVAATQVVAKSDSAPVPAVRSPVTVLAPTLVFLDSTGQILTNIPALNLPVGGKATIRVEFLTSKGVVCTACTDSLALAASTHRLQFIAPS